MDDSQQKISNTTQSFFFNKRGKKRKQVLYILEKGNWSSLYLVCHIVVIKFFKVLRIWTPGRITNYVLPEGPTVINISASKRKETLNYTKDDTN